MEMAQKLLRLCPFFHVQYSKKKHPRSTGVHSLPHSPVQEGVAKGIEFPEGFLGIHHQRIPRDDPLHVPLHHRNKGVSGWLRPNSHAWEILFQQVPGKKPTDVMKGLCLFITTV
jgi:hypothetical protein